MGLGFDKTSHHRDENDLTAFGRVAGPKKWLGREDSNLRMGDPKSPGLPLADAPTRPLGARDEEGRLLEPLLFVLHQNSILDELPSLVVDGMRDVLIRPIRALAARHGDEHPVRP